MEFGTNQFIRLQGWQQIQGCHRKLSVVEPKELLLGDRKYVNSFKHPLKTCTSEQNSNITRYTWRDVFNTLVDTKADVVRKCLYSDPRSRPVLCLKEPLITEHDHARRRASKYQKSAHAYASPHNLTCVSASLILRVRPVLVLSERAHDDDPSLRVLLHADRLYSVTCIQLKAVGTQPLEFYFSFVGRFQIYALCSGVKPIEKSKTAAAAVVMK